MITVHRCRQLGNQVIDVSTWERDPEFEIVTTGAKPKFALIAPDNPPYGFLRPGHRYLFKYAGSEREEYQIWSEILAYELARESGLIVPPVFIAIDSQTGRFGALIEWFFGYDEEVYPVRFIHAIDMFQQFGFEIDQQRGSLRDNISLSRYLQISLAQQWWARTVAFDALIGNTDRHSENWGFLVHMPYGDNPYYEFAPVFDNGTSLCWEIRDEHLSQKSTNAAVDRYVSRGRHHFGWLSGDMAIENHHELCGKMSSLLKSRNVGFEIETVIQSCDSRVGDVLNWASHFDSPVRFKVERAELVAKVLSAKRNAILGAIS